MKAINYILLFSFALLGSACERILDFEGPSDEISNSMIINAVAVADTAFTVYLSRAYAVNATPSLMYYDYEHALFGSDDAATDYQTYAYYKKTAINDAQIEVNVNGQQTYAMVLKEDSMGYVSSYTPKEGDHIVVTANEKGQELRAEATVPAKPKIEVVSYEVIPENPYMDVNRLVNKMDTIMRLTCRITDAGGAQYYRLRIRGERTDHYKTFNIPITYYYMQDIYFSDDELFVDDRLTSGFGGWKPYFSNVFDNKLMNGGSYTFTLDTPKAGNTSGYMRILTANWNSEGPEVPPRVMVELQAISYDYYRYLKSVQLYRIAEDDKNAEPILIHSNVQNGWGILGDRHFVEYGD